RQKLFLQTARLFGLCARLALTFQQLSTFDFGFDRRRDVHRHPAHTDWSTLVANNNRMPFDPNLAAIPMHPSKATRATFSRSKNRCCLASSALSVVGVNDGEPEVRCR